MLCYYIILECNSGCPVLISRCDYTLEKKRNLEIR